MFTVPKLKNLLIMKNLKRIILLIALVFVASKVLFSDFEISKSKIENEFESQTVSGDVEIDDVSCDLFDLDSVSGDTDAKEFYPNTIRFKSVSGDLDISNKTKKEIKIISQKTLSGDVNIDL